MQPPRRPAGIDPNTQPGRLHSKSTEKLQLEGYLAERRAYVREQILRGKKQRVIADELKVSVTTVCLDWQHGLSEVKASNVAELRDLYNSRYEAVIAGHLDNAIAGDCRAAEVVIKATAAAARLNGAEAPVQVTGKDGGPIAVTLTDIAEALAAARSNVIDVKPEPDSIGDGSEAGPGRSLQ